MAAGSDDGNRAGKLTCPAVAGSSRVHMFTQLPSCGGNGVGEVPGVAPTPASATTRR